MKVVIFCGGMGVRMGAATERIPKPMIPIGTKPILWHIMKWYASWGHTDFVLCLGYRAESVKEFFLNYREAIGNDFVLSNGGRDVELLGSDISHWRVTFLDTGVRTEIGQRLKAAQPYLDDDPVFLATYGDALTDAPLDDMIRCHEESGKVGLVMSVRPRLDYHLLHSSGDNVVESVERLGEADVRINGGFFVFKREIFDVIGPGEDLVEEPFGRLIDRGELLGYPYDGFWEPMDTIKDKNKLDGLIEGGSAPWLRSASRV
jgi:glucose-1-phosphate cytidylyltransferase